MCITYSVISFKLTTRFSFFRVKMVNHWEDYVNFQDIEHQLPESFLHHFFRNSIL